MYQHLFIPLDGSARAEKAIPVAAHLARLTHGTITLARVVEPGEYGTNIVAKEARPIATADAQAYLAEVARRYATLLEGLPVVADVATGNVPGKLFALAGQEHSDLIVLCSRGDSVLKRWVFGSVAQETFRHSHLPVLVLNEHDRVLPFEDPTQPLRILVPLDGSELAEAILAPVSQLLSTFTASKPHELHLMRVITTPAATGRFKSEAHITDGLQKEEHQAAVDYLETVTQKLVAAGLDAARCTITTSVIITPDVAGAILKQGHAAGDNAAPLYDLIALATHGRAGIRRAMLGSVTEHVFGATVLPLLVVRPAAHAGEEQRADERVPEQWSGLL